MVAIGRFWALHVLFWYHKGYRERKWSKNWSKLIIIKTFWHFPYVFIPQKVEMKGGNEWWKIMSGINFIGFWEILNPVYGGFREILSLCMYFFDIIGGHKERKGSKNWPKLTNIMTFWHFSYISIPQKLVMNTFSDSVNLWGYWEILSPSMYFFDIIWGPRVQKGSKNWSKLTDIISYGHFSYISIPQKLEMTIFSSSISLWKL